jgi:hypothetical protein
MTPEAQRIAIAKACGWHRCESKEPCWHHKSSGGSGYNLPPDYLNDLNAMHEAEKGLTLLQFWKYADSLRGLCDARGLGRDEYIAATASQRAEAFLRTLNLWVEPTTATAP